MLTIINIKYIRELYFREGKSLSEIMKLTGRNYRTIKKYIEMEDFSEKEQPRKRTRKSDAIRPIIHQWLCEDRSRHHKQRHTAKRIYDRLKEEYPDLLQVCERTVRTLVKEEKTKVFETKDDAYLRLNHPGGQAQVDFGKVEVFEEGEKRSLHALVLSFPKSNAGFVQLTRSETREALLEGLQSMFSYLGYVPNTLWFDRMSSAAVQTRNEKGEVQLAEFVQRFATHYGFHVQFCNPNSGHEKGNVENKVGTLRRNLFVPEPEIKDLEQYNKELFQRCEQLNAQEHYLHKIPKQQLLEEEKTQMIPFNPIALMYSNTDPRHSNTVGSMTYSLRYGNNIFLR